MANSKYKILHVSDLHLISVNVNSDKRNALVDENLLTNVFESVAKKSEIFTEIESFTLFIKKYIDDEPLEQADCKSFYKIFTDDVKPANIVIGNETTLRKIFEEHKCPKATTRDWFGEIVECHRQSRLINMIDAFAEWEKETSFDTVMITGDIFDRGRDEIKGEEKIKELLDKISARSEKVYISYGNHDMKLGLIADKIQIGKRNGEEKNLEFIRMFKKITEQDYDEQEKEYYKEIGIPFNELELSLELEKKFTKVGFKKELINTDKKTYFIGPNNYDNYKIITERIINHKENSDKIQALEKDLFINFSDLFSAEKQVNSGLNLFTGGDGSGKLFTTGVSELDDKIAVVVLNSAWLNVDSNKCHGQLIIGKSIIDAIEKQLKDFIGEDGKSIDGKYVITLLHNDFNWHSILDHHSISDPSADSTIKRIINFSDIILCGHEHKETEPTLLGMDAYVLKVGGTFRTQDGDNTFSTYTLDFNFNTLSREKYKYNRDKNKKGKKCGIWEKVTEKPDFVIELKPKDAQGKFTKPHRSVEECFDIMKKNGLVSGVDGTGKILPDDLISYEEYMKQKREKIADRTKQSDTSNPIPVVGA